MKLNEFKKQMDNTFGDNHENISNEPLEITGEQEYNYYCENCFEEELMEYVEQYDGTILCYGCVSKRLIREQ